MKIVYDISEPIRVGMPIYPGNPEVVFEEKKGASSVHTKLTLGTHTGTHVDAPSHVFAGGPALDALPLSVFIGPCRVLDMRSAEHTLCTEDFIRERVVAGERILVKTRNSDRTEETFYSDYIYLDGDAAAYLAGVGIALFGIDCLSVKKKGSEDHRAHTALLAKQIPILEGLLLKDVPPGFYMLIALPLSLPGLDGSPLRAVLLEMEAS